VDLVVSQNRRLRFLFRCRKFPPWSLLEHPAKRTLITSSTAGHRAPACSSGKSRGDDAGFDLAQAKPLARGQAIDGQMCRSVTASVWYCYWRDPPWQS
jgi:hypothetical protein